jgi:hypothetical protein
MEILTLTSSYFGMMNWKQLAYFSEKLSGKKEALSGNFPDKE